MWQISAGLGLALLVLSGAFKLYYDKKEAETEMFQFQLEQSIQNQKTLETAIAEQNDTLERTIKNHELVIIQVERMQLENMEAQNEVEKIRKKFSKHNLNMLSLRKPKLIENIVNRGTRAVGKDFEKLTDPKQFNESDNSITIAAN
jgi:hypothetical protein|tara:strand:+ start:37 stop:474 length:438 start_codon:yes stop_codon:yes gene_type:complete